MRSGCHLHAKFRAISSSGLPQTFDLFYAKNDDNSVILNRISTKIGTEMRFN